MSEPKSDCCGAKIFEECSGYFYVTPTMFPQIKGNPLNLPASKSTFTCSECGESCSKNGKPIKVKEERDDRAKDG